MEIIVKLAKDKDSHEIRIVAPSSDYPVSELVLDARHLLPKAITKVLAWSLSHGASLFLSKHPNGQEKLDANKALGDYNLTDGSVLFLMWSYDREALR